MIEIWDDNGAVSLKIDDRAIRLVTLDIKDFDKVTNEGVKTLIKNTRARFKNLTKEYDRMSNALMVLYPDAVSFVSPISPAYQELLEPPRLEKVSHLVRLVEVYKKYETYFEKATRIAKKLLTIPPINSRVYYGINTPFGSLTVHAKPVHYSKKVKIIFGLDGEMIKIEPHLLYFPMRDALEVFKGKVVHAVTRLEKEALEYYEKEVVTNKDVFIDTVFQRVDMIKELFPKV